VRKILVTGAAGFLGSHLCETLIAHGHKIVGVDNFFRGTRENIAQLSPESFTIFDLDLSTPTAVSHLHSLLNEHNIETVIHLAAVNGTQYFYDHPTFVLHQNTTISMHVLQAIADTSVTKILYASSSEVYGDPTLIPTPESHPIILNAHADRDSYASSKAIGDFYTRLFAKQYNIDFLIFRIFNLYGERMVNTRYGQVIPEFVQRMLFENEFTILGNGEHSRSFCYIKDATNIITTLLHKNITGFINVGNDEEITINELAKTIHVVANKEFTPRYLPARPHDHKRRRPDLTRLRDIIPDLRYTPLTEGLKRVISFYETTQPVKEQAT